MWAKMLEWLGSWISATRGQRADFEALARQNETSTAALARHYEGVVATLEATLARRLTDQAAEFAEIVKRNKERIEEFRADLAECRRGELERERRIDALEVQIADLRRQKVAVDWVAEMKRDPEFLIRTAEQARRLVLEEIARERAERADDGGVP